jgi:prepilin-type processing-associated H-X9-DG protein
LVVIAIISLLVSILLPSLNRAKDLARSVACMANFKAINSATMIYSADNDDYAPPTKWNGGVAHRDSWVNFLVDGDLIGYDALMCPSAGNDADASAYDHPLAYWQNDFIGGVRTLSRPAGETEWNNFGGTQLSKLPNPSSRVLHQPAWQKGAAQNDIYNQVANAEAAGGIGGSVGFTYRDYTPLGGSLSTRHDDKAPVAMVDGHIETQYREDLVPTGDDEDDDMFVEIWRHFSTLPSWE